MNKARKKELLKQLNDYYNMATWTSDDAEARDELLIKVATVDMEEYIDNLENIIFKLNRALPLNKKEQKTVKNVVNEDYHSEIDRPYDQFSILDKIYR